MIAVAPLAGGISRHGASCGCVTCAAPTPPAAYVDTRPRHEFRLSDGTAVRLIFDHDDRVPSSTSFVLGGEIVVATRVDSGGVVMTARAKAGA